MLSTVELITPEVAQRVVSRIRHQRRVNKSWVEFLARQMDAGLWRISPQGIAIDTDGFLIDGQHRLLAVVKSGVAVKMMVTRGCDPKTFIVLDTGKMRRATDFGERNYVVAIARLLLKGGPKDGGRIINFLSNEEVLAAVEFYSDAIAFVDEHLVRPGNIRGITSAVTCTPIARAWYTRDRKRLIEFCVALRSGVCRGDDDVAAALLARFLSAGVRAGSREEPYYKVERALLAFLNRERINRLHAANEELFPVPEFHFAATDA